MRDDVHDVGVSFDFELLSDADGARSADASDIVASEVKQHHMLGDLLLVGKQFFCQRLVLFRRATSRT